VVIRGVGRSVDRSTLPPYSFDSAAKRFNS
jgi:hypothetical protein